MSDAQGYPSRSRCRTAIERIGGRPDVIGTDLIPAAADPTNQYTVEIAIEGDAIPAGVLRELGQAGLDVRQAGPRADWMVVVATAGDPQC